MLALISPIVSQCEPCKAGNSGASELGELGTKVPQTIFFLCALKCSVCCQDAPHQCYLKDISAARLFNTWVTDFVSGKVCIEPRIPHWEPAGNTLCPYPQICKLLRSLSTECK
eukprot:4232495-Amphidinium_carterae.1